MHIFDVICAVSRCIIVFMQTTLRLLLRGWLIMQPIILNIHAREPRNDS